MTLDEFKVLDDEIVNAALLQCCDVPVWAAAIRDARPFPDESALFVANANTNDVAVVNVKERGASTPLGFIPVGWYPTSVRVARESLRWWPGSSQRGHPEEARSSSAFRVR